MNNALQIDLILDQIFSRLELSDVKSCRRVCLKWNSVSKKYFIQLSTFCFGSAQFEGNKEPRDLSRLQNEFHELSLIPFTKVRFLGHFPSSDLSQYFANRKFIKHVTLKYFGVSEDQDKGKSIHKFDLSNWTGLNLTTLKVVGTHPEIRIPLSFLGTVQHLNLSSVTVVYDARIAPVSFKMFFNLSVCNGKPLSSEQPLLLHDYIDPRNLKKLSIRTALSKVQFDLTEYLALEMLDLQHGVELTGWHNKLTLKTVHSDFCDLDLSQLPPSVAELRYLQSESSRVPPEYRFPFLKSLECQNDFRLLSQCPNLVRVAFHEPNMNLDLSLLPNTVKTLAFDSGCVFTGDAAFKLNKLVFNSLSSVDHWPTMQNAIDRFKADTVVLGFQPMDQIVLGNHLYPGLIEFVQRQVDTGGTFIFVDLKHEDLWILPIFEEDHLHTPVSQLIATGKGPILWKNGIGKHIDHQEYYKWLNN